jgi:hypothetical protein
MRFNPTPLLCSILLLSACHDEDVTEVCDDTVLTHINPSTDFSQISTFAVVDEASLPQSSRPSDLPGGTEMSLFAANRVARDSLLLQGLTEVDPGFEPPDVWLFSLATTQTTTGKVECVPDYTWMGWPWRWDYCPSLTLDPTYGEGTVIIGLAQVKGDGTGEIVFGGTVQGVSECDHPQERLEYGVEKVFAQYPG